MESINMFGHSSKGEELSVLLLLIAFNLAAWGHWANIGLI